jgi:hypothetical protein
LLVELILKDPSISRAAAGSAGSESLEALVSPWKMRVGFSGFFDVPLPVRDEKK